MLVSNWEMYWLFIWVIATSPFCYQLLTIKKVSLKNWHVYHTIWSAINDETAKYLQRMDDVFKFQEYFKNKND